MNLRDRILTADDQAKELVEVPEWGVTIELRGLDVASFSQLGSMANAGNQPNIRQMYCSMLVQGVYDPDSGAPVFTDADVDALASRSAKVVDRLMKRMNLLSGLTEDGDVKAAVDAEGKDSSGIRGD